VGRKGDHPRVVLVVVLQSEEVTHLRDPTGKDGARKVVPPAKELTHPPTQSVVTDPPARPSNHPRSQPTTLSLPP
jgi:hypothetical protein